MARPDPHSVDFAQLRTLRMVFRLNSFSAAADALGVTQSSVSYAINRLREAFGDPLFVRQGAGIAATERCRSIVETASHMLDDLDGLTRPTDFDPATAEETVTISCNTYERFVLIPPLVRLLRDKAPGLKLNVLTAYTQGSRHLLEGEADLVISPVEITESGIYSAALIDEHYVCVADRDNPLTNVPMTEARYLAAQHVVVTYGGAWRSPYQVELEARGHRIEQTVRTPSPADLPILLHGTDLIATAPRRLGRFFGERVQILDCPFPAPFQISMSWAARSNTSPLIQWLRDRLQEVARQVDG